MYKKIGIIGDLHGRRYWEDFIKDESVDLWIFLGDYTDSFHHTDDQIYKNLEKIIALKRLNPEKYILLIGNHDVYYMFQTHTSAGFRPSMADTLLALFNNNADCFQMAFQYQNHIFTHAGISNKWYKHNKGMINAAFKDIKSKFKLQRRTYTLVEKLNWLQYSYIGREILFSFCRYRQGNPTYIGGIVWADKWATQYDCLTGFHQYVGHTPVDSRETYGKAKTTITFCDTLRYDNREFLVIDFS